MQPLLNLKSFLAALLILAVPGALLVAYFRNYSSDAGGHEHAAGSGHGMAKDHHMGGGSGEKNGDMPMKSHDGMSSGGKDDMSASMSDEKRKGQSAMPAQSKMEESGPPALLHIGAKGFFLDRPQTFTPRADQAKILSDIKDRTTMEMMAADKNIQEAEHQLWKLTASDHPDLAEIEAKTREIEKLRASQRVAFIRAVAEAASLLAPEQKEILLRTDSPAKPAVTQPVAPPAQAVKTAKPEHKH